MAVAWPFDKLRAWCECGLASHDLEVEVPLAEDRAEVHRIIYDELCRGVIAEQSRAAYLEIIGRLVDRGSQGVILGCTEIELLLPLDQVDGIPLFPTSRIHAEAAITVALAG